MSDNDLEQPLGTSVGFARPIFQLVDDGARYAHLHLTPDEDGYVDTSHLPWGWPVDAMYVTFGDAS